MTATEIIEEIKRLTPDEREKVCNFARAKLPHGQLPGSDIAAIAKKMADATSPAEAKRFEDELVRGFYGNAPHA